MVGAVGVNLAVSTVSREKSDHAKYLWQWQELPKGVSIYMTDSMVRSFLSSALPSIYDDPSDDRVLKPSLINSFEGAEIGTQRMSFQFAACSSMKRARGRPRRRLVKEVEPFEEEVLIESVAASLSSCNQLKKLEKPVCCSIICCSSGTRRGLEHYTACLNKSVFQQALQVRSGSVSGST